MVSRPIYLYLDLSLRVLQSQFSLIVLLVSISFLRHPFISLSFLLSQIRIRFWRLTDSGSGPDLYSYCNVADPDPDPAA